jgi:Na+/phosphate symporter
MTDIPKLMDLEQEIMKAWNIVDDLEDIAKCILDNRYDLEKVANIMIGLSALYQGKFERLHDMYEDGMKEFFAIRNELEEMKQAKEDNKYGKWD